MIEQTRLRVEQKAAQPAYVVAPVVQALRSNLDRLATTTHRSVHASRQRGSTADRQGLARRRHRTPHPVGRRLALVAGPADPVPATEIEALVDRHNPVAIRTCWANVSADAIRRGSGSGSDARYLCLRSRCAQRQLESRRRSGEPPAIQDRRHRRIRTDRTGHGGQAERLRLSSHRQRSELPRGCCRRGELLDELLAVSDIVILHAPLTPGTHHLIGAEQLAGMRPGALLVNVSRGGLVNTDALAHALASGHIGGAALDVLEDEPNVDQRLRDHPAAVITPHVAFSSDESLIELRTKAAEDVVRVLSGDSPRYPCNTPLMSAKASEHLG